MEVDIVKPAASVSMSSASASASGIPAGGGEFTADDLAAADQLVQLSVSGGGEEEEEGRQEACSPSSSARSVNNAEDGARARGQDEEDDDDDGAGMVDRRARKRYRLVSELYAATRQRQVKAAGGKRKSRDGMEA